MVDGDGSHPIIELDKLLDHLLLSLLLTRHGVVRLLSSKMCIIFLIMKEGCTIIPILNIVFGFLSL